LTRRRHRSSHLEGVALAYVFAIGAWLFPVTAGAQEGKNDSWRTLAIGASAHGSGALADLDGDQRPDLAWAQPQGVFNGAYRYRVDVHLSAEVNTTFDVDSRAAGGLHIRAQDVDGDRDLDLVITSEFGREPIGIWINNGHGAFTKGKSEAYVGSIWQETDHSFQTPPRRHHKTLVGFPVGGWIAEPARFEAFVLASGLPFRATLDPPALSTLYLGSPFRAPPVL
jgi:hypothetical protein